MENGRKMASVVPIHKRDVNGMLKVIDMFHFFQCSGKYLNVLYTVKCTHFL